MSSFGEEKEYDRTAVGRERGLELTAMACAVT